MKKEIKNILEQLVQNNIIDISTIPNIDLYVDQLTTFIDDNIYNNKENHLTKSMINNYCKNKIIPPANKKKYSKNHLLLLIIIYNTKSVLSISDIQKIVCNVPNDNVINYYNTINGFLKDFNENFLEKTLMDYEYIFNDLDNEFKTDKEQIAILATKLSIEANYKKMLAEILIHKYLQ